MCTLSYIIFIDMRVLVRNKSGVESDKNSDTLGEDFHEEFCAESDQFSLSWRNAIINHS